MNQPSAPFNDNPAQVRRGSLFIVSAPSGTGKTTLCKQIAASVPGLWHSVSYTTRKPRPGEVEGQDYYFLDEATFRQMIDRNEFVEWAHVYGNLYGTPRKMLSDKLEQGIDVLLEASRPACGKRSPDRSTSRITATISTAAVFTASGNGPSRRLR